MTRHSAVMKLGSIGAAVVLAAAWMQARQTSAPTGDALTQALLVEVRGLRTAMEQMASAGPRIQLFTSRLQLQEARINNMIRRLDTVRDSLAPDREALATAEADQKRWEERLATTTLGDNSQARLEITEQLLPSVKRRIASLRPKVSRLSAEESQLAADIATEQARWSDINHRLDELEKLLSSRR